MFLGGGSGTCRNVCPSDANALTSCNNGRCVFACQGASSQCTSASGAAFCAFLQQDNTNCGARQSAGLSALSACFGAWPCGWDPLAGNLRLACHVSQAEPLAED